MTRNLAAERRAIERIVQGAFGTLTGRNGEPLHYAVVPHTPVGTLGLAAGSRGLLRLDYVEDEDHFLDRMMDVFGDRPLMRSDRLDSVRRELDRYFSGRELEFDVAVDLSSLSDFDRRVLEATARIRPGRVRTYTEVARVAGSPRASRAAGNALHKNPVAIIVPCHRVVRSDGSLGGYGGGLDAKEWLLQHEGVALD